MNRTKKKWGIILLLLTSLISLSLYTPAPQEPISYYNRESGELKSEKIAGEKWLIWLYYNPIGEATLWTLAKRKFVSTHYGKMMDRPHSAKKIAPFIADFDIDMSSAQTQEFANFNAFFTRKLREEARPIDTCTQSVISPADGKILAYTDISHSDFIIKEKRFDVLSFLNNPELAQKYKNGSLLIIRLAPTDYHRFHFPISGTVVETQKIEGDYYSVNPYALRQKAEIFCLNKREYTRLTTSEFGEVIIAEVGATMVGSIQQTYKENLVNKGKEKGYFKFGGSTVVLLFEKDRIHIDEDLLINTAKGYETTVKMGERIGKKK